MSDKYRIMFVYFDVFILISIIMITLVPVIRVTGIKVVSNTGVCTFSKRKMCQNVFVYGTLKRNQRNHHWLTKPGNGISKFVSEGTTKTKYPLVVATKYNIPFLLKSPGKGYNVKGEIYEVDEKMLSNLDVLEEHPNFYTREIDDIIVKGATSQCWVYFLKHYNPKLLQLPMISNYSSTWKHYAESDALNAATLKWEDVIQKNKF